MTPFLSSMNVIPMKFMTISCQNYNMRGFFFMRGFFKAMKVCLLDLQFFLEDEF